VSVVEFEQFGHDRISLLKGIEALRAKGKKRA
jgi:hypothetical protein